MAGLQRCIEKYSSIIDEYVEKAYRGEYVSFTELCRSRGVEPDKHCLKILFRQRYGEFFENLVDGRKFGWRVVALLEYIARNGLEVFLETARRDVLEAFRQVFGDWVGSSGFYNFLYKWFDYVAFLGDSDIYAEVLRLRLKGYMVLDEEQYGRLASEYGIERHGYYIYRFRARCMDGEKVFYVVATRRLGKHADRVLLRMVYADIRERCGENAVIEPELRSITLPPRCSKQN